MEMKPPLLGLTEFDGMIRSELYAEIRTLRARVEQQAQLIAQCKEALMANLIGTSGRTPKTHEAIAAIEQWENGK
jgi:hypothetical protein